MRFLLFVLLVTAPTSFALTLEISGAKTSNLQVKRIKAYYSAHITYLCSEGSRERTGQVEDFGDHYKATIEAHPSLLEGMFFCFRHYEFSGIRVDFAYKDPIKGGRDSYVSAYITLKESKSLNGLTDIRCETKLETTNFGSHLSESTSLECSENKVTILVNGSDLQKTLNVYYSEGPNMELADPAMAVQYRYGEGKSISIFENAFGKIGPYSILRIEGELAPGVSSGEYIIESAGYPETTGQLGRVFANYLSPDGVTGIKREINFYMDREMARAFGRECDSPQADNFLLLFRPGEGSPIHTCLQTTP